MALTSCAHDGNATPAIQTLKTKAHKSLSLPKGGTKLPKGLICKGEIGNGQTVLLIFGHLHYHQKRFLEHDGRSTS